VTWRKR